MPVRETATQKCPRCYRSFTVLADEYGDHDCPYCGFSAREPEDEADEDEEEDEE